MHPKSDIEAGDEAYAPRHAKPACVRGRTGIGARMTPPGRPDKHGFGEAGLGEAQSSNPPDVADMIEPDAVPLDTDVEDADLFLGDDDELLLDEDDDLDLGEDALR